MDTFEELCVKLLAKADVEDLIELLHIEPEALLEKFSDSVEEHRDELEEFLDE